MGTVEVQEPAVAGAAPPSKLLKHDALLSNPADAVAAEPGGGIPRVSVDYVSKDDGFIIPRERVNLERQYGHTYFTRLSLFRPVLAARCAKEWPGVRVTKVLGVTAESAEAHEQVAVIGTLFKDMKLRPNQIREHRRDPLMDPTEPRENFCGDDDALVVEDEGARLSIRRTELLPTDGIATGSLVAVRGRADAASGDLVVDGVLWPELAPQAPLPAAPPRGRDGGGDAYVAFVSGVRTADAAADRMALELLVDFVTGNLGAPPQQALAARIGRLVVAGGMVGQLAINPWASNLLAEPQTAAVEPVRDADVLLTELAAALPVDVMPSTSDPSNHLLPQQPLHRQLFPGAGAYDSFVRSPNPHAFEVDGVQLLGTSGENVDNMRAYTRGLARLDLLEYCLRCRHICPTAPDSLGCYPFVDDDPFVLRATPHVVFAGGQPEFETRAMEGPDGQRVRLICIPDFSRANTVVLLNLRTLEVEPLTFQSR